MYDEKNFRAEKTEAPVWNFVSGVLKDPERLRAGLDEMLSREQAVSSRNPEEEERGWLKRLSDIDRQKDRFVDLHLDEKVDKGRYESKVRELNRATETAESELERLRNRQSRIRQLERDRDALLESYASIIPEQLDALLPEERHRVYKMLNLSVIGYRDGGIEITSAYEGPSPDHGNDASILPGSGRIRGR